MRILLVEDDAALAARVVAALADAGFAVDHCTDGQDAEFRGQTEEYDGVIVIDKPENISSAKAVSLIKSTLNTVIKTSS